MPVDNIERAVKKGTGELEGAAYEEMLYEGYAPGGVAVLVEAATDNKNRSAAELRALFTKHPWQHGRNRKRRLDVPPQGHDHDRRVRVCL